MMRRHRLPPDQFAALAAGYGGAPAVRALRDARLSRHLLLVKFIVDAWPGEPAGRDEAVEVLAEAQSRKPEVFADLLSYPLTGAWAAQAVRRLRGRATSGVPLHVELGHFAAAAAAAALRSGLDAGVTVYVRDGSVAVPTVGSALSPSPQFAPVRLTVRGETLTLRSGGGRVAVVEDLSADTASWRPLRRLAARSDGLGLTVPLDDLDPYRHGHHAPAADRLTDDDAARWRELFAGAWALLVRYLPARAEELRAGLQALVPLVRLDPGSSRSATLRDAFGTFGLTPPASAADLVVTLVHEFQHSKLSALLDLAPLYDSSAEQTYYAPWRTDPRPIGALLQGVYAFLGVGDTWRRLRGCPALQDVATRKFAEVREQVNHALAALDGSSELTAAGSRFVAGMRSTMDGMMAEPVPSTVVRLSREALAENLAAWRQRQGACA